MIRMKNFAVIVSVFHALMVRQLRLTTLSEMLQSLGSVGMVAALGMMATLSRLLVKEGVIVCYTLAQEDGGEEGQGHVWEYDPALEDEYGFGDYLGFRCI